MTSNLDNLDNEKKGKCNNRNGHGMTASRQSTASVDVYTRITNKGKGTQGIATDNQVLVKFDLRVPGRS